MLSETDKEISLTFAKGLAVILAFDGKDRSITMTEIARKLDLNRAVTRRLVRTLEQLGYVSCDRGRYELTPHILRLSQGFIEGRGISQVIQPIIRAAAQDIGEAVSFAMVDGHDAVYVAHSFIAAKFTLNRITIGSRTPLLPTAVGRSILAFLDDQRRAEILGSEDFRAYTDRTETDPARFGLLLHKVRADGFCFSESEYVDGVSSLAVPVFDSALTVSGALSIIFPQGTYSQERIRELVGKLRASASAIGATL